MSRLRLQLLLAATFALAWTQSSALEPKQEAGILPIDPPTPYLHYRGSKSPPGRVLVVHGLDVSKETTRLISAALADGGFEVYAIDLPGHGDSPANFQSSLAQQAIHNAKVFLGDDTIVLGHSLGAGLLLDLAATEHFPTMVLLAAPPISIAEVHADRVLIATGEMDVPRIRSFVPIAADIAEADVESWLLPWGAHSAPIFNPAYVRRIVEWLGGDGSKTRTTSRIVWTVVMLAAAIGFGAGLLPKRHLKPVDVPMATVLVRYIAACSLALFTLKLVNPLSWLRLFATDYLVGFLFITGLTLTVAAFYERWAIVDRPYRIHTGILAAAFVIAVPGLLVASQILHTSLSGDRWWRFPGIALAGLPLFLADEWALRRIHPRWKSVTLGLLTRGLLFLFILTGVLTLNRESAFLLLIVPLITVFWVALWLAAGLVHRHTQSALAAAVFAALVQGWVFAALFVRI